MGVVRLPPAGAAAFAALPGPAVLSGPGLAVLPLPLPLVLLPQPLLPQPLLLLAVLLPVFLTPHSEL